MDLKNLFSLVGKEVSWKVQGLLVNVVILDARTSYGRLEAKIEPVSGNGFRWIEISSLVLTPYEK